MDNCRIEGCDNPKMPGRSLCLKHYLARVNELRHQHMADGTYKRTMYKCVCINCGRKFPGFRKNQYYCSQDCYNAAKSQEGVNNYVYDAGRKNIWEHRNVAEDALARKLTTNEIVHHMDGDPRNNALANLMILSRADHASLHNYLNMQRAIQKKRYDAQALTKAWLEQSNANAELLDQPR